MTDTVFINVLYVNILYMTTAAAHLPRHAAWFLCLKVDNKDQNWPYQTCHADEKASNCNYWWSRRVVALMPGKFRKHHQRQRFLSSP